MEIRDSYRRRRNVFVDGLDAAPVGLPVYKRSSLAGTAPAASSVTPSPTPW